MNVRILTGSGWRRIAAALAVAAAGLACSAEPVAEPSFSVRSWSSDDGLPAAPATALARTPDGYLWLATSVGLVRFDGARFVTFTTNTTPGLGDNRISCLLVETNGALWIGTEGGTLARRKNGDFEAVLLDARLRGRAINSLAPGQEGEIWLATAGCGAVRLRGGVCDFSTPTNGLPAGKLRMLIIRPPVEMLARTRDGLKSLVNGRWQSDGFGLPPNLAIYALARDWQEAGVWVATAAENPLGGRGARVFQVEKGGTSRELLPYPWLQDSQRSAVTAMFQDRRGRLWVGTQLNGLFYWDAEQGWQQLKSEGLRSLSRIVALAEDEDGLIWMSRSTGELHRITDQQVTTLRQPEAGGQNNINSACVTRDRSIWVGTEDAGVLRYENGHFIPVTNGLASLHIGTLFEDSRTNLWAGTWAGLHRWDGRAFKQVLGAGGGSFVVLALCEDRTGNLWASSSAGGVYRISPDGQVRLFGRAEGLDHFYIRGLAQDAEGRICVAVTDRGLYRLVEERFEKFQQDRWAGAGRIHALHADAEGGLWIATEGDGLFCFKDGRFRQWTLGDGLPDMVLRSVVADNADNLWFSSNKGIFGCRRKALEDYERGKSPPLLCWRLTVADGLDGNPTSGAGQPVAGRSADGRLWFPNQRSLAVFDPANVSQLGRVLAPLVEEVVADGKSLPPREDGSLHLRSGARRIEFHYTLPDLRAPERLRFQYHLEGSDSGWTEAGNQRVAYYGLLAPGDYQFRVKAGGVAADWSEVSGALQLTIVPRLWERWSVRVAGALTLLGATLAGGWAVGRARLHRRLALVERQQALERERTRIARDIHDELGAGLTQISLISGITASNAKAEAGMRAQSETIAGVSRSLARTLDEIVWAVRPQNDNLENVVEYLGQMTRDLCDGSGVQCLFAVPSEVPAVEVSANARHNLILACREAVTNVLKHAGATEVHLQVRLEPVALAVEILDNGRGFQEADANPRRSGLTNMRQRLSEIGGTCEYGRSPMGGARVRFLMPLSTAAATPKASR